MNDEKGGSSRSMIILFALIVYLFIAFFVLHCIHVAHAGNYVMAPKPITQVLSEGLDETLSKPFKLDGVEKYMREFLKYLFMVTIVFVVFVAYEITQSDMNKHENENTAKGSDHWCVNYRKFFNTYTKFNPELDKKENGFVKFFLDTFGNNQW